ncbi:hypothetical protein [Hyphomonas sp. UBA4494]|jgi:very-short-patch-repair endonuclease|uniref:hypothetical protein n=1 Tax=Hyphomonas sp. UBA4494 TaxID=1946631 RepID=UPI0025C54F73|nr:hypothetical protein [Hyphomonas sp. UBA4494]
MADRFSRTPEHTRRARALRQSASKTEYKVWLVLSRDARRDAFLDERGISIMRIPVSHIDESLEAVAQQIRSEIELIRQREG